MMVLNTVACGRLVSLPAQAAQETSLLFRCNTWTPRSADPFLHKAAELAGIAGCNSTRKAAYMMEVREQAVYLPHASTTCQSVL